LHWHHHRLNGGEVVLLRMEQLALGSEADVMDAIIAVLHSKPLHGSLGGPI
jgi:hypothetical protein